MHVDSISSQRDGAVQWITLNRPAKRNALTKGMTSALVDELRRIGDDSTISVVVLTGAGPAFCAGRDVGELVSQLSDGAGRLSMPGAAGILPKALTALPQLCVAMVNGYALGEGLDLALMCDLVVAAEDAELGDLHIVRGVVPSTGCWNLPRLIGAKRAAEMLYLGRRITGAEAAGMGMVNRVASREQLRAATDQLVSELLQMPPTALRLTKRTLVQAVGSTLEGTLEFATFARSVAAKAREVEQRAESYAVTS